MSLTQKPSNKAKFLLKIHLIFVVKYRKRLLVDSVRDTIIDSLRRAQTKDFLIDILKTDIDHVHMMISHSPNISVSQIVRHLKQKTTVEVWKSHDLSVNFWKEKTFWSNGYFVCSVGNASENTVRKYIENQG